MVMAVSVLSLSGRYGFVVYADPSVTDIACAGLNGMRMGERTLTVRRATEVRSTHIISRYVLSMCLGTRGSFPWHEVCCSRFQK